MLHQFQVYSTVIQLYTHIYIYIYRKICYCGIVVQLSRVRLWFRMCLYVKEG